MRSLFKYVIGASALFIAGCSAYFSIKGMGLLFMGSAMAVMVMAASMELGKLVAASFLYQYWKHINIVMRFYLTAAVVVLVAVTSLGIYGYLARAYEETNTHVILLENQIATIEQQIEDAQRQIDLNQGQSGRQNDATRADIVQRQQRIVEENQRLAASVTAIQARRDVARKKRESDIELQQKRVADASQARNAAVLVEERAIEELRQELAVMDRAVDAYTQEGPGGFLKNDGIRRGQMLRDKQKAERERIAASITAHGQNIEQLRESFARLEAAVAAEVQDVRAGFDRDIARLDAEEQQLRQASAAVVAASEAKLAELRSSEQSIVATGTDRIDSQHQRIQAGNEQIAQLKREVASTDIGSYRFVARAFNAPVDDVVKWLILLLVAVFDPLAVVLTVGFNVALMRERKPQTAGTANAAPAADNATGGEAGPRGIAWAPKVAVALGVVLLLLGVSWVGYIGVRSNMQSRASNHAALIPADSFAVVTLRPSDLRGKGEQVKVALSSLGAPLPGDLLEKVASIAGRGFATDRNVYVFVKYPQQARDNNANPVLMLGIVAAVDQPDAAEDALSELAQSLEGVLLPRRSTSVGVSRSRSMVRYGQGRYLDPEGGFFTFGLNDGAAIVLIELEGDPANPAVEQEMRLCLDEPGSASQLGRPVATLPARATSGQGAVALWFDAQRCFAQMPKNSAAQARHQRLQRYLDFDLLLTVRQDEAGLMNVAGDYQYAVDKFDRADNVDVSEVLVELGDSTTAGMPGALMDQCAGVLDFDPLIMRLRQALAAGQGDLNASVVVQKTVASPRQARFILEANFADNDDRPAHDALAQLEH